MRVIGLLPVLLVLIVAGGAGRDTSALEVKARYECLWWSPRQMENLNPDKPPPQETRVVIDRWEYTDPVGVPHPDTVILVVTLRAATARDVRLAVKTQWLTSKWTAAVFATTQTVRIEAGSTRDVELTIPVADMILERHARRLRSLVLIDGNPVTRADLPVVVGD
ncbi:MAG: hypothetical protein U1E70_27880 [Acetobacteraceae bacterium]|nr:hypothetical protein [Pseudomonadota bacterium]